MGTTATMMQRRRERAERVALPLLMVSLLLAVWWLGHDVARFIPSPAEVASATPSFLATQEVLPNLLASFRRVAIGLALSLLLGTATALVMVTRPAANDFFETYVVICFGIPGLAAALFALMIFGFSEIGVWAAIAVVTYPFVTVALRDGANSVDRRLEEMASVYQLPFIQRHRHITFPTIAPYFMAAARNMHALGWKIAVIAEVFMARDGLGAEFKRAFDNFTMEPVILWLGVFLLTLFGIEYGVLRPLERFVYRWRP